MKLKALPAAMAIVIVVALVVGALLYRAGQAYPLYTDAGAPGRLSTELQELPREERFRKWYQELAKYETPHKRLTDAGRGVAALGVGIFVGTSFLLILPKLAVRRVKWWVALYWTFLWGIRLPLTMRFYSIRQARWDYPSWGDSIIIGVFSDGFAWIVGCITTLILLGWLVKGRRFPVHVSVVKPLGRGGWLRVILISLWLLILLSCVVPAIQEGDEGAVISCTAAIPVLLLLLSQPPAKPWEVGGAVAEGEVERVDA